MTHLAKIHNEDAFGTPPIPDEYPFWICQYGHTYADRTYHEISYQTAVTRIEYVLAGRGVINSQNYPCNVEAGDTYILHEGENHNYFSDMENPMDKVWVNVTGVLAQELIKLYKLNHTILFRGVDASPYIYRMHEICKNTKDPYEIQAKGSDVFCELIQFLARQKQTDELIFHDFLDDIRAYIDLHIEGDLSIEKLCEFSQKSPNQTIRLFKKKFGITPHQYILKLKLGAAATMLRSSELSVARIASRLRFSSTGTFSDFFHKHTGMRPSEYRRMHRVTE